MAVIWLCAHDGLKPVFFTDVHELLKDSPFTWYVTSGARSLQEQTALYKKYLDGGAKAAPPGMSAHNYGLAVDVVVDGDSIKPGLQMMWNIAKSVIGLKNQAAPWLWLRTAVKAHPRLHSGWSFGDWPHIERYNWKEHKHD